MDDEFNLMDPYKGSPDFYDDSSQFMSSMYREVGEIVSDKEICYRPASSVSMEDRELTLMLGDSKLIRIIPTPSSSNCPELVWSSSDQSVATISDNAEGLSIDDSSTALLKTKGIGTAIITARNDYGLHCSSKVRVVPKILENFTITYDANGGTGSTVDKHSPYEDGTSVSVMENHFISPSADKIFDHWNTEADDSGTSYEVGDTLVIKENTVLYAQYIDLNIPLASTYFKFIYEGDEMPLEKSNRVSRVTDLDNSTINSYLLNEGGYTQEDLDRIFAVYYFPESKIDVDHPENGYYLVETVNGNIIYDQEYLPLARYSSNSIYALNSTDYKVVFKQCTTFITWYDIDDNGTNLITPFEPGETVREALGSSFLPLATMIKSGNQSSTRRWEVNGSGEEITIDTVLSTSITAIAFGFTVEDDDTPSKDVPDDDDDNPPSKSLFVKINYVIYPDVLIRNSNTMATYEDDDYSQELCGSTYTFFLTPTTSKTQLSNSSYNITVRYSGGGSYISCYKDGGYEYYFKVPSTSTTIDVIVTMSKSLPPNYGDDDDDWVPSKSLPDYDD